MKGDRKELSVKSFFSFFRVMTIRKPFSSILDTMQEKIGIYLFKLDEIYIKLSTLMKHFFYYK